MPGLRVQCPAAVSIEPPHEAPSVICGVLELSNHGAHAHGFTSRGQVSPVISGTRDAGTVHGFCAGAGIPGSRCSYTACAIWRAGREADWAQRRGPDALRDEQSDRRPTVDPELAEAVSLSWGMT